jgi:hypothetical protein
MWLTVPVAVGLHATHGTVLVYIARLTVTAAGSLVPVAHGTVPVLIASLAVSTAI